MNQMYKWILCSLFFPMSFFPAESQGAVGTHGSLKFGPRLWFQVDYWSPHDGCNSSWPIGCFIAYHSKTIDKGVKCIPIFGVLRSRYESFAIEGGLCYKSIHMRCMRHAIEPKATFFLYSEREIGSIVLNIKTLSLPIVFKGYIGRNRKLYLTQTIAPLFVLSMHKKDWVVEWANQPGQELLKKKIYSNGTSGKQDSRSYGYVSANDKKHSATFYNLWKKKATKDQYTDIDIRTVLNGKMGWEVSLLGIGYETDGGLMMNWNVLHISVLAKHIVLCSSVFSMGYDLSKLFHYDVHTKG